ncbi:hypothetical protein BDV95DRAFT_610199 [Massariosphaeria phaeospora]|uniref:Uncharacterized protein n=1 Tax=Massariosphaeria phaeospora TaxID=100035 RepID=A0A7C8I4X9_9PLEO|nr:hypothetical protein BDV95DRAFT_610199 [Massariosphaeria phaeospora]
MPLSGLGLDARNVAFPTSSPSSAILKDSAPRRSHEGTDRISLSWITDNNKSNTDVDPSFFPTVENIAKAENHGYLTPTGSALGPGAPVQLNHHASAQSDPVQQETTNLPGIDEDRLYAQQQLQDAREELLGMRFALRARRTALTGLRQSAGAAEGALLSHLRNIFRAQGIPMQEDLEKDYKSLVAMRNKLGASDVEYDEAEQKYNREEWRYTQKEGDFVESLADDGPSFEGSQRTKERLVEAESLTRFATGNEETQSRAVEDSAAQREISAILELARSASLPELQRSIGNIQSTKHDVSSMETSRLVPASLPDLTPKMDLGYRRRTPSFSNSESALSQSRRVWPEMAQRIESWVLDTVQSSPLKHERLRYDPSQKGLTNSSHTDFAQEKDFQIGVMAGSESSNTTLTARQLRPQGNGTV